MVRHLFPRFLDDPTEYARAEAYWRALWDELVWFEGQAQEWQYPWLKTAYANGTPFQDGDPIFSAWSPSRKLGVRVIQNEPGAGEPELTYWHDVVGDQWSGEVQTLVISCILSGQTAALARDLISYWVREGRVSVCYPQEGPPVFGVSRENPAFGLRIPA